MVATGIGVGMKMPALVFTLAKAEWCRTMYLIAMLRAKGADVEFHHLQSQAVPDDIATAYQFETPFFVDRGLVAYGAALDELIHERYPGPSFMPLLPTQRAQMRMLVSDIQRWYSPSAEDLAPRLLEAGESYQGSGFFLSTEPSAVDWALVPLLMRAIEEGIYVWSDARFKLYAKRMLTSTPVVEAQGILIDG